MRPKQYWRSNYKYHWNAIPAINPAKRDSPGDHLLVNVCMRTSKMGGSNDGSGQMQWLPPGQNWNDGKVGEEWREDGRESFEASELQSENIAKRWKLRQRKEWELEYT